MPERSNLFESHWLNQWLTQNRVKLFFRNAKLDIPVENLRPDVASVLSTAPGPIGGSATYGSPPSGGSGSAMAPKYSSVSRITIRGALSHSREVPDRKH
jgi:hypothetical protein